MKRVIKKALSSVLVFSIVSAMIIPVNAAKITNTTWSKDFDDMVGVTYSKWLNPADTALDCTFYGDTKSVLTIKDDEDVTHGKVMHIEVDASTVGDRYVTFNIPDIKSGKFMFEFDAKINGEYNENTKGPGILFDANKREENQYNNVVDIRNSIIKTTSPASEGYKVTTLGTYEVGEWKTIRTLFDVDKQEITIYSGGNVCTRKSGNDVIQKLQFYVKPGKGGVSFDNFKLYPVNGGTAEMNISADGEKIQNFVDVDSDSIVLSLTDSYFGSVPEVTLKSYGTDIVSDADDTMIDFDTEYNNGNINIILKENLGEGIKYKISIPEGIKDMMGRVISNNEFEFYAAENNGWVRDYEVYEDFAVETVPAGEGEVGTTGEFSSITSPSNLEILTSNDGSYSAGTALKFPANSVCQTSGVVWKKGKIYLQTKMQVGLWSCVRYHTGESATIDLFTGQKSKDVTGDGVIDETIAFMYQAPLDYPNKLWDRHELNTKEIEEIDYVLDIDNLKSYITYNGESFTLDTPYSKENATDIINKGFQGFKITGASDPLIVDYFNYWHEYLPAIVKDIKFVDIYGEESIYTTETPVNPTTKIKITFSEPMKEDSLSSITVNDGISNVEYTGNYDADTFTYTIMFDKALVPNTEYTLAVTDTIKDAAGLAVYNVSGTFMTGEAVMDEDVDVSNIVYESSTKTAYVNLTAKKEIDGGAGIFVTYNSEGRLIAADLEEVPAMTKGESKTVSGEFKNPTIGQEIRFFFFDKELRPYCLPKTGTVSEFDLVDFTVNVEEGRDIRVMQISDPQIIDASQCRKEDRIDDASKERWAKGTQEENCYKYIRQVVEDYDPDLILVAGDFVYGEFDDDGSNHEGLVGFFDTLETPWAPVFGNHELETNMGVDWMCDVFEKSEYCLFKQRELTGNGNYSVGIEQGGELKRVFFMLDSNGAEGMSQKSYNNGHSKRTKGFGADQIEWYTKQMKAIKIVTPETKISAAFHIPMAAFSDILGQYGTVPIDLDSNPAALAKGDYGYIDTSVSGWDEDKTVFNGMKKLGVDSMFVGHQHRNNGSFSDDEIRIVFGLKSSTYDSHNYLNADGKITSNKSEGVAPYVGGTVIDISSDDGSIKNLYNKVYQSPVE